MIPVTTRGLTLRCHFSYVMRQTSLDLHEVTAVRVKATEGCHPVNRPQVTLAQKAWPRDALPERVQQCPEAFARLPSTVGRTEVKRINGVLATTLVLAGSRRNVRTACGLRGQTPGEATHADPTSRGRSGTRQRRGSGHLDCTPSLLDTTLCRWLLRPFLGSGNRRPQTLALGGLPRPALGTALQWSVRSRSAW